MQRLFHNPPTGAYLAECDPGQLDVCLQEGGWVWLDLTDPTPEEVRAVGSRFRLDLLSVQDVLDVTLLPKVDDHADYLFIVLHGVVIGDQQRLATDELDLFISRDFLVTVHETNVAAIDWVADHATTSDLLATSGPAGVAAAIAEAGSRRYLPLLDALDERINNVEDHAIVGDPRTLGESQALRRDVILLRRILGPQRAVMRQLAQSPSLVLDDAGRRAFADVYDHYFRLVESLDAARSLLGAVMETYRGAVAERTNEVMKVLTVFSVILLPLTLIAGLWGMNFANIPGADWGWGFVVLLGAMAILALGTWVYFVRRGFVGGQKLRKLPKAVGLSLVHLGSVPHRAMTGRRETAGTDPEDLDVPVKPQLP